MLTYRDWSRRIALAALCLTWLFLATAPGRGEDLPSQQGLPLELLVDEDQPLDEQLRTMQTLYEVGLGYLPKGGILESVKSMFGGGEEKPNYATVGNLAEHAARVRGDLVQTEGIYEAGDERGVLRSMGHEIHVEIVGGSKPQGFGTIEGGADGMPVAITGRVETQGEEALLRADMLVPSAMIAGIRVARILELQEQYEAAVEAYEEVATNGALASRPLAAFARVQAGHIALTKLRDEGRARAQYSAAWQPYTVENSGNPVYYTWVPAEDEGWERVPVAEALAPRLDRLNAKLLGYRVVDLFVRIAGGSPAMGVILMAIVVRLAIYPLTKKQLDSQRRMQAIQPQIQELQKKHATDKQKFQEEFWKLCQENNCNPLGGCLPMLVQMPILIFLYRGIREYIVRFDGASFLWVPNLAQPNMVLLILYTLSMVAFQKMAARSQPTADPQQQQQQQMMAYLMPIMFFFFFQSFPAAFILYWLGSNLIYFGEQGFAMRGGEAGKKSGAPAEGERAASDGKSDGEREGGGLLGAIVEAVRGRGGGEDRKQARPASYAEKQKQEKGRKQGRGR